MKLLKGSRRANFIAVITLAILPALFHPLAAVRRGVFYVGDVLRLHYPLRAAYTEALRDGTLPLWSPHVLAGFPLLAEGQTGVFYPFNLFLHWLFPLDLALNYTVLLSLSLAGLATYGLARRMNLSPPAAFLSALVFIGSGFMTGHTNHLNILAAAAWLPIQLIAVDWLLRTNAAAPDAHPSSTSLQQARYLFRPRAARFTFLSLTVALQLLAGHPQIALLSILTLLAYGLFRTWQLHHGLGGQWKDFMTLTRHFGIVFAAVPVGGLLAAVQLVPTWELVQESVRAGGLSIRFLASFSWHPALLATLIVPFALGNPYPNFSVELAAYLGILPLLLTLSGLVMRRDRESVFLASLAVVALLLAFGDHTPVYPVLSRLPLLNLFRVPARFLLPFTLAMALLAGKGFDEWSKIPPPWPIQPRIAMVTALIGGLAVIGIRAATLEALLHLRWVLPVLFLSLACGLLTIARRQRIGRASFATLALTLTFIDLYGYSAVYKRTYNDVMPLNEFYAHPLVLQLFPKDTETYRTLTHQAIVPDLSVMRASLYPNTSLLYGIPSANGYFPLTPARHARYLAGLTPQRLNLLNVRYFLIPQLLPVDPQTEAYDLGDPFALNAVDREVTIPPTRVEAVAVISFTSQSADWPQGAMVAEIVLTDVNGTGIRLPLRMGIETAEWAYDRPDVQRSVAHGRPPVAHSWPARSGFPPVEHMGNAYRAEYKLSSPMTVTRVRVVPHRPAGLIHVEQILLIGHEGSQSVAHLAGRGEHFLVYRDLDVAIYENRDALPRAFIVPRARVVPDDATALAFIDDPAFDPRSVVLLAEDSLVEGEPSFPSPEGGRSGKAEIVSYRPRRVVVRTSSPDGGYLVLLDSYYPGWRAQLDGEPVPIYRADVLFRAVPVPSGDHTVTFEYRPFSLRLGVTLSSLTLMALASLMALPRRLD